MLFHAQKLAYRGLSPVFSDIYSYCGWYGKPKTAVRYRQFTLADEPTNPVPAIGLIRVADIEGTAWRFRFVSQGCQASLSASENFIDLLQRLRDAHRRMSKVTDHQIHIEQLEMFVRVGATENERQSPQRLTANITLWPECDLGQLEDRIERTIDYSAVCDATKKFASNRANHLIETLANGIAAHLLESFPIRAATVEVRKFVLPDAEYASVTVTRASVTG